MKTKKLIITDCDGVLTSTSWVALFLGYKKFLFFLGMDHGVFFKNFSEFREWWDPDWKRNETRLGLSKEETTVANEIFYQVVLPHVFLLPWTGVVFGRLSKKFHLAIYTNRHRASARPQLLPIVSFFKIILGAEDVVKLKPHPEGIDLILEKLKIEAKDALMIGDMPGDLLPAKERGLKTAAVVWKYGLGRDEDFVFLSPDFILRKPYDFLKMGKIL